MASSMHQDVSCADSFLLICCNRIPKSSSAYRADSYYKPDEAAAHLTNKFGKSSVASVSSAISSDPVMSGANSSGSPRPVFRISSAALEPPEQIAAVRTDPAIAAAITAANADGAGDPNARPKLGDSAEPQAHGEASGRPRVLFVYGSQTGTAQELARNLHAEAHERGLNAECMSLSQAPVTGFSAAATPIVIMVTSSTGDGEPPDNARAAHAAFKDAAGSTALKGVQFTMLGLGDSSYATFMSIPRFFNNRFIELGATPFYTPAEVDAAEGDDSKAEAWQEGLWAPLQQAVSHATAAQAALRGRTGTAAAATGATTAAGAGEAAGGSVIDAALLAALSTQGGSLLGILDELDQPAHSPPDVAAASAAAASAHAATAPTHAAGGSEAGAAVGHGAAGAGACAAPPAATTAAAAVSTAAGAEAAAAAVAAVEGRHGPTEGGEGASDSAVPTTGGGTSSAGRAGAAGVAAAGGTGTHGAPGSCPVTDPGVGGSDQGLAGGSAGVQSGSGIAGSSSAAAAAAAAAATAASIEAGLPPHGDASTAVSSVAETCSQVAETTPVGDSPRGVASSGALVGETAAAVDGAGADSASTTPSTSSAVQPDSTAGAVSVSGAVADAEGSALSAAGAAKGATTRPPLRGSTSGALRSGTSSTLQFSTSGTLSRKGTGLLLASSPSGRGSPSPELGAPPPARRLAVDPSSLGGKSLGRSMMMAEMRPGSRAGLGTPSSPSRTTRMAKPISVHYPKGEEITVPRKDEMTYGFNGHGLVGVGADTKGAVAPQPLRIKVVAERDEALIKKVRAAEAVRPSAAQAALRDPGGTYSALQPFWAPITAARYETAPWSDRKVLHIEFSLADSGMRYAPGDVLGVMPANSSDIVINLLKRLQRNGNEVVSVVTSSPEVAPHLPGCGTLAHYLTYCVDLTSAPKKSLLRMLAQHCSDPSEKRTLTFYTARAGKDAYTHEMLEHQPSLLDLLLRFSTCRPPMDQLLDALPPMLPRSYSITSAPQVSPGKAQVALTVVRFRTRYGSRLGLASGWLDRLAAPWAQNDMPPAAPVLVPIFLKHSADFKPPPNPLAPVIIVGPGTGIAPFRGFLQHRRAELQARAGGDAAGARGDWLLFFGCRRDDEDFLYRDDLESFKADGTLSDLLVAFSRVKAEKVYVQHLLREHGARVADLIVAQRATVYVCGDGAGMAKDVHDALRDVLRDWLQSPAGGGGGASGGLPESEAAAEALLADMVTARRYVREVWS